MESDGLIAYSAKMLLAAMEIFVGGGGDWGQEEALTDKRDLQEWPFQMVRISYI